MKARVPWALAGLMATPAAVVGQADPLRPTAAVVGTVEVDGFASRWATAVYADSQVRSSPAPGSVVVDQRGLRFRPSVLAVPVGTTVVFRNSDPVIHSVFSPGRLGAARQESDAFDLGRFFPGTEGRHTAEHAGVLVILCRIHPEMAAYIVVAAPTRAVTVTDATGRFQLTGLPPGPTTLRFWHPLRAPATLRVDLEPGRTSVVSIRLPVAPR